LASCFIFVIRRSASNSSGYGAHLTCSIHLMLSTVYCVVNVQSFSAEFAKDCSENYVTIRAEVLLENKRILMITTLTTKRLLGVSISKCDVR
jgi:hypothetical protein